MGNGWRRVGGAGGSRTDAASPGTASLSAGSRRGGARHKRLALETRREDAAARTCAQLEHSRQPKAWAALGPGPGKGRRSPPQTSAARRAPPTKRRVSITVDKKGQ